MRIPVEHFSTIPVFALSPMNPLESQSKRIELDQSLAPINNNNNSRKISLPNGKHFLLEVHTKVSHYPPIYLHLIFDISNLKI